MSEEKTIIEMLSEYPDVLTFAQMCEILQCGRQTGYGLLRRNEISHRKVGRNYIIAKINLLKYVMPEN